MYSALLKKIARGLGKIGVPYMVIGGQAVLLHGEPRLTTDIDLTLGTGVEGLSKILGLCEKMGLVPLPGDPPAFAMETMVLPARDKKSGIRVDFIFSNSAFERAALSRTVGVRVGGTDVRFASAEDLVIHKLVAGRPRDLEDARGVLVKNAGMDTGYMRAWLREFDTALGGEYEERLNILLAEAPNK